MLIGKLSADDDQVPYTNRVLWTPSQTYSLVSIKIGRLLPCQHLLPGFFVVPVFRHLCRRMSILRRSTVIPTRRQCWNLNWDAHAQLSIHFYCRRNITCLFSNKEPDQFITRTLVPLKRFWSVSHFPVRAGLVKGGSYKNRALQWAFNHLLVGIWRQAGLQVYSIYWNSVGVSHSGNKPPLYKILNLIQG